MRPDFSGLFSLFLLTHPPVKGPARLLGFFREDSESLLLLGEAPLGETTCQAGRTRPSVPILEIKKLRPGEASDCGCGKGKFKGDIPMSTKKENKTKQKNQYWGHRQIGTNGGRLW